MSPFRLFDPAKQNLKILTKNEKELIEILIEAAKKIDAVYLLQENDKYPGANFYPDDATNSEIESAARSDPKIFSPFTVVERNAIGQLVAIPFFEKYKKQLDPIVKLIKIAAAKAENESVRNYLERLARALVTDDYQTSDIAWLQVTGSNLDFTFGPHERNLDKRFFVKRAYQSYVGIVDRDNTRRARRVRDILYTNIVDKPDRIAPPSIVDIHVVDNIISSGLIGRLFFTQQHLPSDQDTTERYGSRIIGFISSIDYKFDNLIYPIFEAIFEKNFKNGYTKEILRTGNYYFVLLHSIAQQLHRYKDSRSRLKELFPVYDEANSVVAGVKYAKNLVLKGVINQKELEALMISYVCWIFSEWIISKSAKSRESYLKGDALTLNFLVREGAILEKEGISWPNFAKMFFEIENLSAIFVRYLEFGSYLEAQEFLGNYLSLDIFEAFDSHLAKIKAL